MTKCFSNVTVSTDKEVELDKTGKKIKIGCSPKKEKNVIV